MKNQEQLHQLIHKLTKSEKRSFKLYIKKYNNNQNQSIEQLFDLLNKMPKYKEDKLLIIFSKSQLSYNLHKLKNLLLNALCDIHFNNNAETAGEIINRIELGFKYEDLGIIEENIKKGLEIAERDNKLYLKLYLLNYLKPLYSNKKNLKGLIETNKQISELTNLWNRQINYELLWGEVMRWRIKNMQKENVVPIQFSSQRLTKLFDTPPSSEASFNEKEKYLDTKRLYWGVMNDSQQIYEIEKQLVSLYSINNKTIPLQSLHSFVLNNLQQNKIKEAEELLKMSGIIKSNKDFNFDQNANSILSIILLNMYFLYKKDYENILETEPIIEKLLKNSQLHTIEIIKCEQLLYPLILTYFKTKSYNQCLNLIIKARNWGKGQIKFQSLMSTTFQFIEAYSHHELGNTKILPSLINSIQYTINVKKTSLTLEEKELIRILKAIIKQEKFSINTHLFEKIEPFTYYQIFFPYLEEKQKELDLEF